ncbi:MAG: hypothetical protein ACOCRX_04910 [Candidatus Woesearchaeota archaeon]
MMLNTPAAIFSEMVDVDFTMYAVTLSHFQFDKGEPQKLGNIKMSPESFKLHCKLLQQALKDYENIFGEIKTYTPEMKKKSDLIKGKVTTEKDDSEKEE